MASSPFQSKTTPWPGSRLPPPILELILTPCTAAVFSMNPLGRREANATWPLHVLGIVFVDCLENTLASGAKAGVGRAPFARFQAIQARGADDRTP